MRQGVLFGVTNTMGTAGGIVVRHTDQTPFGYRLFTPELQWQSRGNWRISQGCLRTPSKLSV